MKLFKRSRKAESHQQEEATRSKSGPLHEKNREKEYQYVQSQYGYDAAPPSLQVPSRSADSSTVQHYLISRLSEQEPISDLSRNTASVSSYHRNSAREALQQHREYEAKYQKQPQILRKIRKQSGSKIRKQSGSKSVWRPSTSEKEKRQPLFEQRWKQREEKFYGPPPAQTAPQTYYEQRGPPPNRSTDGESRDAMEQRGPAPNHHRSTSGESRDSIEQVPILQNIPSIDSGLQYTKERSRYSVGGSVASSYRGNNQRVRQQQQQPMQPIPEQSRYSMGNSVASSHQQQPMRPIQPVRRIKSAQQIQQPIPQQRAIVQSQTMLSHAFQQPLSRKPGYSMGESAASSHRSKNQRMRQQQPMQPVQSTWPMQPMQHLQKPVSNRLASHSVDDSTISTHPDAFRFPNHGTYHQQYHPNRNSWRSGHPTRNGYDRNNSGYHAPHQNNQDARSRTSARERKRSIEQTYKDYVTQRKGLVPTPFAMDGIAEPSKKNKLVAAVEAAHKQRATSNVDISSRRNAVPTAFVMADLANASIQLKNAADAEGLLRQKEKTAAAKKAERRHRDDIAAAEEDARRLEAAPNLYTGTVSTSAAKTKTEEKRIPIAPVVPLTPKKKGFFKRLLGRMKYNKKSKSLKKTKEAASTGSKKPVLRIQVNPTSNGSIRKVNPASGTSASTRELSHSTDGESKTKMHWQSVTKYPKDIETPMSLAVARSIASSHRSYQQNPARYYKDVGIQDSASIQVKASSNKIPSQNLQQQQQSTASRAQEPKRRMPNTIFFPDSTRNDTAGCFNSIHPDDIKTKFYGTGRGSASQPRKSSHVNDYAARVSTVQSSSFDRRQAQSRSFASTRPSYDAPYSTHQYSRGENGTMGPSYNSYVSRSASHLGLKKNISGDSDPWVNPRARINFDQWNHRGSSNRSPYIEGRPKPPTETPVFNFGCV